MTTYASHTRRSAQALYENVTGQSSDMAERLALLSQRAKLGASPRDVEAVRQRLWADFMPGRSLRG
jgi:hypothetical protein